MDHARGDRAGGGKGHQTAGTAERQTPGPYIRGQNSHPHRPTEDRATRGPGEGDGRANPLAESSTSIHNALNTPPSDRRRGQGMAVAKPKIRPE